MLPGMYEHFILNSTFIKFFNRNKQYFYDNVNIYTVYGNFQFCIWDGGRIFFNYTQTSKEEMDFIINTYNKELNTPIRYVFTNNCLEEKHYHDRFCNLMLKMANDYSNEIVIADDNLKEYIQNNYQSYKFISSTTKCLKEEEDVKKELDKNFHMICLDYNLNKNMNFLNSLSKDNKEKIEFLINAICPPNCPNRKEHYRLNSLMHLNLGKKYKIPSCIIQHNTLHPANNNSKNNLTPQEIFDTYYPMGFYNFKLEGRTLSDLEVLLNYVKYMVKPEYQLFVTNVVMEEMQRFNSLQKF